MELRQVVVAADRHARGARHAQEVQAEVARDLLAHRDAANAVAAGIEPRREHADADLARQHGQDAAADAALRGHADRVHPLAGEVVHPARGHDAQDALDELVSDGARTSDRIRAAVRERRRHDGQVAAVDEDRALLEVEVERVVGMLGQHVEVPKHVPDRAIAVSRLLFGAIDRVVDREAPAGVERIHRQEPLEPVLRRPPRDQARRRDRAGVDHRVERPPRVRVEADRVERIAAGLDPDLFEDALGAAVLEREPVRERLRDRLDRELLARVADLVEPAVGRGEADAEPLRIRLAELRDVGSHLARAQLGVPLV
jgi:hypothetical protein